MAQLLLKHTGASVSKSELLGMLDGSRDVRREVEGLGVAFRLDVP